VKDIRALASIIGEEELSPLDHSYLEFGEEFEKRFITQGYYESRTLQASLDLGWDILSLLPQEELVRIRQEFIQKYYRKRQKPDDRSQRTEKSDL
jgi:V/A-type H+-transporting ATPase subunit B